MTPAATDRAPASADVESAGASPSPVGAIDCVPPQEPSADEPAPWSVELRDRLNQSLARLAACTAELPEGDAFELTLRLVYDAHGNPLSQHVVRAAPEVCGAVPCLATALKALSSPRPPGQENSYVDVSMELARGQAPSALPDPPEPLTEHTEAEPSCIDPQILKLSRARVAEVVATTFPGLKTCHSQAIARDRKAAGEVTFEFVIGSGGGVDGARVREATFRDCEALECMLQQFRGLEFAPPVGRSVRVLYPIELVVEQPPTRLQ